MAPLCGQKDLSGTEAIRKGFSMQPRLRLFDGDGYSDRNEQGKVSVRLREILDPLKSALLADSTFLSDFGDDEIALPADLYDVLTCFQRHHRSA